MAPLLTSSPSSPVGSVRLHHLSGSNLTSTLPLQTWIWKLCLVYGNSHRTCIPSLTGKSRAPSILTTGSHRFSRWQQIRYRYTVLLPVSASRLCRLFRCRISLQRKSLADIDIPSTFWHSLHLNGNGRLCHVAKDTARTIYYGETLHSSYKYLTYSRSRTWSRIFLCVVWRTLQILRKAAFLQETSRPPSKKYHRCQSFLWRTGIGSYTCDKTQSQYLIFLDWAYQTFRFIPFPPVSPLTFLPIPAWIANSDIRPLTFPVGIPFLWRTSFLPCQP